MTTLLSVFFMVSGAAICLLAAVGVLRLPDFFMRMHAATKAGVAGCGLLLIGVAFAEPSPGMWIKVTIAVIFLLLTTPVAGHLLARAGYVGGVPLWTGTRKDQLQGELRRGNFDRPARLDPLYTGFDQDALPRSGTQVHLPSIQAIRFGVVRGQVDVVASRALALAETAGITPSAHVIIDEGTVEAARDPVGARKAIERLALQALEQLNDLTIHAGRSVDIRTEEGDPEDLLAVADGADVLLLLPSQGWFDHGADLPTPEMSWGPDGLLRLPGLHGGPVLFTGARSLPADNQQIVIRDDGASHIPDVLAWALSNGLWHKPKLHLVWQGDDLRRQQFGAVAAEFGVTLTLHRAASVKSGESDIPEHLVGADALILGSTPRPLRAKWYGHKWTERISPGWQGEILLFESASQEAASQAQPPSAATDVDPGTGTAQKRDETAGTARKGRRPMRRNGDQNDGCTSISEVVVTLANGVHADVTIDQAIALAKAHRVPLVGLAIVDTKMLRYVGPLPIGGISYAADLRRSLVEKARRALADTVQSFEQRALAADGVSFSLFMEEGDPVKILRSRRRPQALTLIGRDSWFDHGVGGGRSNPLEYFARRGLYPLISVEKSPAEVQTISFVHDGTPHSDKTLQWLLTSNPWPHARLRLLADPATRNEEIDAARETASAILEMEDERGDVFSKSSPRPDVLVFGNEGHAGWINRARATSRPGYNDIPIVVFG